MKLTKQLNLIKLLKIQERQLDFHALSVFIFSIASQQHRVMPRGCTYELGMKESSVWGES